MCISISGECSSSAAVTASVFQGSAVGPSMYVVNACDLHPIHEGNFIDKYADDTYLIVPSGNDHTTLSELQGIENWATDNNLKLNMQKSVEIVFFSNSKTKTKSTVATLPNITRVETIKILGVTIDNKLSVKDHINNVCQAAAQNLYAIKLLKSHGLKEQSIYLICQATVVSRLTYASPAWWGFTSAADRQRLEAIINRAIRWGFYKEDARTIEEICSMQETTLFNSILTNPSHVLYQYLPPQKKITYHLRSRGHDRELPKKDNPTLNKNFFNRLLYKSI